MRNPPSFPSFSKIYTFGFKYLQLIVIIQNCLKHTFLFIFAFLLSTFQIQFFSKHYMIFTSFKGFFMMNPNLFLLNNHQSLAKILPFIANFPHCLVKIHPSTMQRGYTLVKILHLLFKINMPAAKSRLIVSKSSFSLIKILHRLAQSRQFPAKIRLLLFKSPSI